MAKVLRPQRLSIFVYVEGHSEKIFIEHLKDFYSPIRGIYIPVYVAGGKGPDYIVNKACRVRGANSDFNHSFILLDTDVPWSTTAIAIARKNSFELIGNTPCLEGLFLSVLDPHTDHSVKSSKVCKSEFRERHVLHSNPLESKDCSRLFPRTIIDTAMPRITNLDRLVTILRGNY